MKEVSYKDRAGRYWMVSVPDKAKKSEFTSGIPVGPPSLESLDLSKTIEISLHNNLFQRKIWTSKDFKHRRNEVVDAIRSAYKADAEKLYAHYLAWEGQTEL